MWHWRASRQLLMGVARGDDLQPEAAPELARDHRLADYSISLIVQRAAGLAGMNAAQVAQVGAHVATKVSPPRIAQHELAVWTLEEARTFLESIREEPLEAAFVIALSTGLRRGEVVGLRWEDINLEARTLTVSGTVQRVSGMGLVRAEPKTPLILRRLPVADFVVQALLRRKERQELQRPGSSHS